MVPDFSSTRPPNASAKRPVAICSTDSEESSAAEAISAISARCSAFHDGARLAASTITQTALSISEKRLSARYVSFAQMLVLNTTSV
jgi:hypothetical protein